MHIDIPWEETWLFKLLHEYIIFYCNKYVNNRIDQNFIVLPDDDSLINMCFFDIIQLKYSVSKDLVVLNFEIYFCGKQKAIAEMLKCTTKDRV